MRDAAIKFSQWYTYGAHLYRSEGEVAEIVFENIQTGARKVIVDDNGKICDFPGFAHPELVAEYVPGRLDQLVRFRSMIAKLGDRYALIWQVQPDGRYWEDEDGFGGTSDDEVMLYARLDDAGEFVEPFRFYSIGRSVLYGTAWEESAASALTAEGNPLSSLLEKVPALLGELGEMLRVPGPGAVLYNVPGTVFQVRLALKRGHGEWFVQLEMSKRGSGVSLMGWLKSLPLVEQRAYLASDRARADAEEELGQLLDAVFKL